MDTKTTIIRKAKTTDIEIILELVFEFYDEKINTLNVSFSKKSLTETIRTIILNQIGFVAEKNGKIVGVIGGIITPSIFDTNQIMGQEIIWYISSKERKGLAGIRLLSKFEKECKKMGADFVTMVHLSGLYEKELNHFYHKRGYKLLELQYIKKL